MAIERKRLREPQTQDATPDYGQIMHQTKHATLVSTLRAMVTDAYEGDYQSGVECLAAALLEHAHGSRVRAIDALASVDDDNKDYD